MRTNSGSPDRDITGNVDIVISMVDEYGLSEEECEGSPSITPEWDWRRDLG